MPVKTGSVQKQKSNSSTVKAKKSKGEHSNTSNESSERMQSKIRSEAVTDLGNGYVYVEKGVTKNMGDYNSVRVTVGITMPIGATDAQLREAKRTVYKSSELIEKILEEEVNILLDPPF